MGNLDFSHGGNIYAAKRKFKRAVIDFSANINPLGLPYPLKKTLDKNFFSLLHYPDPEARDITRRIARYWGTEEENILVGNGSIELIYLIIYTFRPRVTAIPIPTFSEYERAARCIKSKVRFVGLKERGGFRLKSSRIKASDILFLCNPNNPTGNLVLNDPQAVGRLPGELVVADEAFMDFLPDEKSHTLIWKARRSKKIIVLRTFTKFFALPGLRIGYLLAHKDIIRALRRYQMPWSVNAPAQKAALIMLNNRDYINKTIMFIEKEREFLFNEISRMKRLIPYPSVTNFLLVRIEDKTLTSSLLARRLIREKGILIRDCANFKGLDNKFIRLAVRTHPENLKLVKALRELA